MPVECEWAERQSIIPSRQPTRGLLRAGAAHNYKDKEPHCRIEPAHCVGSFGVQSVRRAVAISVGASALGQVSRRLECVARLGRQRGAGSPCRRPPGVTGPWQARVGACRAQRCLTPRSSGAPTAGHQGPPAGTVYIFCQQALASCRRRPLSSNVRHHKTRLWRLRQEVRRAAPRIKQPRRGIAAYSSRHSFICSASGKT